MKPGKTFPVSFLCSLGQNTSKYLQILHLSVPTALQKKEGGRKPLSRGRRDLKSYHPLQVSLVGLVLGPYLAKLPLQVSLRQL